MEIVLLLVLLTVGECGSSSVVGRTGENVTLTCKYDIKSNNVRPICWNRGELPSRGCDNQLIATGFYKANKETSVSSRYQLLGRLDEGDVSLTILNLTETDAGRYGCRVDIYGVFNDQKDHFDLTIDKASTTMTSSTELTTEASSQQTSAGQTPGQMTSTEKLLTSSSGNTSRSEANDSSSSWKVVLVSVIFVFTVLITTGGVVIMARKWRQVNKIPRGTSTVQFNSTSSSLHLHSRGSAVENIYQIDEGTSYSEYEACP